MSIASKEARESNYWLRLLRDGKAVAGSEVETVLVESESIINMLTAIVKTAGALKSDPKLTTQNTRELKCRSTIK
jgi:hypothetical protein